MAPFLSLSYLISFLPFPSTLRPRYFQSPRRARARLSYFEFHLESGKYRAYFSKCPVRRFLPDFRNAPRCLSSVLFSISNRGKFRPGTMIAFLTWMKRLPVAAPPVGICLNNVTRSLLQRLAGCCFLKMNWKFVSYPAWEISMIWYAKYVPGFLALWLVL